MVTKHSIKKYIWLPSLVIMMLFSVSPASSEPESDTTPVNLKIEQWLAVKINTVSQPEGLQLEAKAEYFTVPRSNYPVLVNDNISFSIEGNVRMRLQCPYIITLKNQSDDTKEVMANMVLSGNGVIEDTSDSDSANWRTYKDFEQGYYPTGNDSMELHGSIIKKWNITEDTAGIYSGKVTLELIPAPAAD